MKMYLKRDTDILKGISIILMLFYLMFSGVNLDFIEYYQIQSFFPSLNIWGRLGEFGVISFSIFIFIGGYTFARISKERTDTALDLKKQALTRYIKLAFDFFFVYIIIVCTSFLGRDLNEVYGTGFSKWFYAFVDAIGLQGVFGTPTLNESWFYMGVAIVFTLFAPFWVNGYRKWGGLICILAIVAPYIFKIDNFFLNYLGVFSLGIWCAEENILEFLKRFKVAKQIVIDKVLKLILCILVSIIALYIKWNIGYIYIMDLFLVLGISYFGYEYLSDLGVIGNIIAFIGRHSINIWMISFVMQRFYLTKYIYSLRYSLFVFIAILSCSLLSSVLLETIKRWFGFDKAIIKISESILS